MSRWKVQFSDRFRIAMLSGDIAILKSSIAIISNYFRYTQGAFSYVWSMDVCGPLAVVEDKNLLHRLVFNSKPVSAKKLELPYVGQLTFSYSRTKNNYTIILPVQKL